MEEESLSSTHKRTAKKGLLIVFLVFVAALFLIFYSQGETLRFFEGALDLMKTKEEAKTHAVVFQADKTLNQPEITFGNNETIHFLNKTETRVFLVVLEGEEEIEIPLEPLGGGTFYRSKRFVSEERPFYIKDAEGRILAEGKIIAINQPVID